MYVARGTRPSEFGQGGEKSKDTPLVVDHVGKVIFIQSCSFWSFWSTSKDRFWKDIIVLVTHH